MSTSEVQPLTAPHVVTHEGVLKPFGCSQCQYRSKYKGNVTRHIKEQHGERPSFECTLCGTRMHRQSALDEHMVAHTNPNYIPRQKNKRSTSEAQPLTAPHVVTHEGVLKSFGCSQCQYRSKYKSNVTRHIKEQHGERPSFECTLCGTRMHRQSALDEHMVAHTNPNYIPRQKNKRQKTKHSEEKTTSVQCTICGKHYADKWNLKTHVQRIHVHRSSKTFPCTKCTYIATNSRALQVHDMTHTGYGGSVCHYALCDYRYDTETRLNEHIIRQHTGKYQCETCGKRYHTKHSLKGHLLTHTNARTMLLREATAAQTLATIAQPLLSMTDTTVAETLLSMVDT